MVEASQKAYNWTEEVTAASVRPKLGGTALTTIMAQEKLNNSLDTWTEMKTVLIEAFGTPENNLTAARAMENLKQGPKESVQELHDKIIMALDKKNYAVSKDDKKKDDYLKRLKSELFIFLTANLRQEIRDPAFAGLNPPDDAAQLLKTAKRIEEDMKIQIQKKSSELEEVAKEEKKEKEDPKVEAIAKNHKEKLCYNCGKPGHIAAVCRSARTSRPRTGGYQPRPGGYQAQGRYQPRPSGYAPRPGGYQPRPGGPAGPRPGGYPPRGQYQQYRPRPPPRQYVHEMDQPYYGPQYGHEYGPVYQLDYQATNEYYPPEDYSQQEYQQPAENYQGTE